MQQAIQNTPSINLKQRWADFREDYPQIRIRDAANQLSVTEVELLATSCGDSVIRLRSEWDALFKQLNTLGRVMALTRNAHAVHERHGVYNNVKITGPMGLVLDAEIDLRLFLAKWDVGFAVKEESKQGLRHSLQFFDKCGTAVHKIYLTDMSNLLAYNKLVKQFRAENQSSMQNIVDKPENTPELADTEIDIDGLYVDWDNLQDVHDFFALLKKYQVSREQALRLAGDERAYRVKPNSFRELLTQAKDAQLPIMLFVGSPGCIQIHTGTVNKLVATDDWFNVLDPDFNLHVREDQIASAWVVKKPSTDGQISSLELFDAHGELILQMFGKRKPGIPENTDWRNTLSLLSPL